METEGKEGKQADLHLANLQEAILRAANLQKAFLGEANLERAQLEGANIQWAELRETKNLTVAQIQSTTHYILAFLSDQHLQELGLPPDHNKKLATRDLINYDLNNLDLRKANLTGFNLEGATFDKTSLERVPVLQRLTSLKPNWTKPVWMKKLFFLKGQPDRSRVQKRKRLRRLIRRGEGQGELFSSHACSFSVNKGRIPKGYA